VAGTASPLFQVIHSIPGRIRIHIFNWNSFEESVLEHRLRLVSGVCAVNANATTGNVLIHFEPFRGGKERVLRLIDAVLRKCPGPDRTPQPSRRLRRPAKRSLLIHAPAIASLILSLLSCTSPLGVARLALEALHLCGELSLPASG
jgi:hypothetical protein